MTGCLNKFAEIDHSIRGAVKFGDGSTVEIEGRGSVLFEAYTGDHRILTEVYYIPRLKNNIISLGQLDEIGCKYSVEDGVMVVQNRECKVLAKVRRTKNRLYVFHIDITLPECLLSKSGDDAWL